MVFGIASSSRKLSAFRLVKRRDISLAGGQPGAHRAATGWLFALAAVERRMKTAPALALALALCIPATAHAEPYPSRPISIVVPFPAGGSPDMLARTLGECMRASLGQPVVIENVTGASGSIGTGRVARAAADGYMLGIGTLATHVVNGAALNLPYDVTADFAPVALLSTLPLIIVGRKDFPATNLNELLAWLRANPARATVGVGGLATRLAAALFQQQTGTSVQLVPYRGAALARNDLVGGQIDLTMDLATNALPHVRAGAIRAYAVTGEARLAAAPDIPAAAEAGLSDFRVSTWHALYAPKLTPSLVINRINGAVHACLADAKVVAQLSAMGHELFPVERQTPEALASFQRSEIQRWWPVIKAAGIKE
jgi:tripartite-type tricarboxylate transporter receptor subunit TctC